MKEQVTPLSREAMDAAKEAFKDAEAYDYCDPDKPDPLASAITAYLSATGWRTIDSAPKDKDALAFMGGVWTVARWDDCRHSKVPRPYWRSEHGYLFGTRWDRENQPTVYVPLPAPPSPTGKEE